MIILYHKNNKVTRVKNSYDSEILTFTQQRTSENLIELATKHPNELLVWCNEAYSSFLNVQELESLSNAKNTFSSYRTSKKPYLTDAIGYVTESPFINVNKKVMYPTWLMSSDVGSVHASVILALTKQLETDADFDFFLNSIARLCMPLGLFCYSNPKLLNRDYKIESKSVSNIVLFKFVKQHYKNVWVFLLFVNFIIYERKFPVLPLILSLFYKRRTLGLDTLRIFKEENSNVKASEHIELDVIIPTIGRKQYLYNILKDLSKQTLLPKHVIIVEQKPALNSKSELDYLTLEEWPFKIKHYFTNQTGACNARNIALQMVESDWVFLADDDIVLKSDFIERANTIIKQSKYKAFTFNCHLKDEVSAFKQIKQWETFGSGCSIVNSKAIKSSSFSMAFEHGFGEDADFGMQLRNKGVDVVYLPKPSILHIKAPIGGFRVKSQLAWADDDVQPKPSPTIMLYLIEHHSPKQLLGYKTILFLKYYKRQSIKNPFSYYKMFKKQWNHSQFWAKTLKDQHN